MNSSKAFKRFEDKYIRPIF